MLILFAAARLRKRPAALVLENLDRDLVFAFLDELEEKRNNTVATRNARLAAIRSFFHHVAAADPASFGVAQRVLTIPTKRAHIEVTRHLTNAEVDAIIAAPDQRTPGGRRDRTFLRSWRGPARGSPKPSVSMLTTFSWNARVRRCCCTVRGAEIETSRPSGSGESAGGLVARTRNCQPRTTTGLCRRPQ